MSRTNRPQNVPHSPQQQQQHPQQQYQNHYTPQVSSHYADANSPIASVRQKENKPHQQHTYLNTPSNQHIQVVAQTPPNAHSTRVGYYQPQQYQTHYHQHQQQHSHTYNQNTKPSSPHLFSPKNPGLTQNPHRYRQWDKITTPIVEMDIPYLEIFGVPTETVHAEDEDQHIASFIQQPQSPPTRHIFRYVPPCMIRIKQYVATYRQMIAVRNEGNIRSAETIHQNLMNFAQQFKEDFEPFHTIRHLPALPLTLRKSPIPPKRDDAPKITLALDLDETLAHCSLSSVTNPSCTFNVDFQGQEFTVYGQIRPHLEYFLRQVSQWYEVIIFTASQKSYADTLLNIIDPMNEFITHRVFRDSCVNTDGLYLKDLTILGRRLEHVMILDNSFQAFGYQLSNGIPIESWFSDENDVELLNLVPMLRHLKDVDDVRPYLRSLFSLQEFTDMLQHE